MIRGTAHLQRQVQVIRTHQRLMLLGHLMFWSGMIWVFRITASLNAQGEVALLPIVPVLGGLGLLVIGHLRGSEGA